MWSTQCSCCTHGVHLLAATWNLLGNVYAITAGPYGTVLALCWAHRGDPALEAVNIVLLTEDSTGWRPVAVHQAAWL